MNIYTPVEIGRLPVSLDHATPLLSLGSCFADEIGSRLARDGFDILCNPFGTLYNPLSIAALLRLAMEDKEIGEENLVYHDGLWHSWMHHSRFSSHDRNACLARCNQAIHLTHERLLQHPFLLVTFGTAWIFRHNGEVVANCHKLPPQKFCRERLTVDAIVETWQGMEAALHAVGVERIYTVSPIRHLADTAHGNQLSKATLLLAVERLSGCYFPAYEILLDELRDYRFFGRDMCHPSELAGDIVYERFLEATTTPTTRQEAARRRKEARRGEHKEIVISE